SQSRLEDLERANLFVVALDDTRQWYRYHHLFAQVVRHRLASRVTAEAAAALHRRAAGWFEQHEMIAEAIHHALAAQDFERVAGLLEQSVEPMWMSGELQALHRWLAALPSGTLSTRPRLLLAYAL